MMITQTAIYEAVLTRYSLWYGVCQLADAAMRQQSRALEHHSRYESYNPSSLFINQPSEIIADHTSN
jgi:hypothetical protein